MTDMKRKQLHPMKHSVSLCRPAELDSASVELWRSFQAAQPALSNPFLTPEFALAFGRHRVDTEVAIIRDGGEIVGFFPFERRRGGIGCSLAYGLSDCQGVVHRPDATWGGFDCLLESCGLAVWEFDHLVGYQSHGAGPHVLHLPSPVIDLPGAWEEWQEQKRQSGYHRIKGGLRQQRKLGREVGAIRFELDARREDLLHLLMQWKSAQYRRTSRPDRFAQPWFRTFVEDLFSHHSPSFAGQLSVLYAGDRPINVAFNLRANGILAYWIPAYDRTYAKYSPGWSAVLEMIKASIIDGHIKQIDLGKGAADYKKSLKSTDLTVAEGWVERPSIGALAWRARTEPRRRAMDFVLRKPRLRLAARRTLKEIGELRERLDRGKA